MERTITFIAEDKKRKYQEMKIESEHKDNLQEPQELETEVPDRVCLCHA